MPLSEDNLPTQATLTVIFYFGPGDSLPYRLSKKYIVKNWTDEAHLRRRLDEIAAEMNHLSGYGIWSMAVAGETVNFTVSYKDQFKPYHHDQGLHEYRYDFSHALRFLVGYTLRGSSRVYLELPRLHLTTGAVNPVEPYKPGDTLFQIKSEAVGSKKQIRKYGTIYHISYDQSNPFLQAFQQKLDEGLLEPHLNRAWQRSPSSGRSISWWDLPKTQWSWPKRERLRKEAEKQERAAERQRQQQEKAGIVYKDKKQSQKADQVYLIQMGEDNVYKIGISNAPGKRLRSLNTSSPFDLRLVHQFVADPAEEAEAQLHTRFAAQQMSGEWFRLTPEQVAEVKRITAFEAGQFFTEKD